LTIQRIGRVVLIASTWQELIGEIAGIARKMTGIDGDFPPYLFLAEVKE
jgi:hypothetical protein